MGKFCQYCGRKLEEGEVCDCQTIQEEKTEYVSNPMTGKAYSFVSSPFMCANLLPYRGRIYTDINVDEDKLNIKMSPKRKNKIPTVYFKDIKTVCVSVKLSLYTLLIAILCALVGLIAQPAVFLIALLWLWIAVNREITLILTNGNVVKIYSNAKNPAENFANELRSVLKG